MPTLQMGSVSGKAPVRLSVLSARQSLGFRKRGSSRIAPPPVSRFSSPGPAGGLS